MNKPNKKYKNFIFSSSFGAWRGNTPWEDNNNKLNSWVYSGVGNHKNNKMRRMKNCIIILTVLTLTSCAGLYRSIEPEEMVYLTYSKLRDSVEISYNYNTQKSFNNKKYKKAERKSGYVAISLKIVNNSSDTVIILPNTLQISIHDKPADIISYKDYVEDVKQATGVYLLYSIFGPWVTENGSTSYIPIGLGIGLLNFGVASYANSRHEKNMKRLEMWGKTIKPKTSASGVVFLRNYTYDELKFSYLKY